MSTKNTVVYRVTDAPSLDRLADSWKYRYPGDLPVKFTVERHEQGDDPRLVSFDMDVCLVDGLEHISERPLTVRVKLRWYVGHSYWLNATAEVEYPRRKGSMEHFLD